MIICTILWYSVSSGLWVPPVFLVIFCSAPSPTESSWNSVTAVVSRGPFFVLFCSLVQFLTSCSNPLPLVLGRRWFIIQFYRWEDGGPENVKGLSRLHSSLKWQSQEWNPSLSVTSTGVYSHFWHLAACYCYRDARLASLLSHDSRLSPCRS